MTEATLRRFHSVYSLYRHIKSYDSLSTALPIVAALDLFARGDKNILLQRLQGLKGGKNRKFNIAVEKNSQPPYMVKVS